MNLALKDIRHNLGRFALTTVGIGLLLMVVMGMGGIYRGVIEDATLLIDQSGHQRWQDISYTPFTDTKFLLEESKRLLALPPHIQQQRPPVRGLDRRFQLVEGKDRLAVDGGDHVAGLESAVHGGAARCHLGGHRHQE